jgi:hypothetical protein
MRTFSAAPSVVSTRPVVDEVAEETDALFQLHEQDDERHPRRVGGERRRPHDHP